MAFNSALWLIFSFRKYSTAFTSWLVVASISLIFCASASEKSLTIAFNNALASAENSGTSAISAVVANFCNQRTSTVTRYFIKPNSLKIGRNDLTLLP